MQLDLFESHKTKLDQLKDLKKELKVYQNKIVQTNKKLKLLYGDLDPEYLVVTNPSINYFNEDKDKYIISLLSNHKFILTYNYLIQDINISKITITDIKKFSYFIQKIIDITEPKKIICMGENSIFSFFKKKFVVDEYHGKQIGNYNNIPIYLTYDPEYFITYTKTENREYKLSIQESDWRNINAS